jgi:hypothetical protein
MSAASILRLVAAMSAVAFGALVARAPLAHAEAPLRPRQAPGYYRIMVGDFESTAVGDLLNAGSKLVLIDAGTSRPWSAEIASFICGTRGARPVTFGDGQFAAVSSIRSKEGSER